jgi:uncharacterized oxidoreductase
MKTTKNTILVTGGSAGIGFEIAKLFAANHNTVIITGRDKSRLQHAATELPNVTPIVSDVTNAEQVDELVRKVEKHFPSLNVVINNAGKAWLHNLSLDNGTFEKAADEIQTNYLSVVRLNERLLPLLKKQKDAAIINVSSIVAFSPNHMMSTYGASKAALHSYTQSLRLTLSRTSNIKVFEIMPPLVNTDFSQAIGGANGISPETVAKELMNSFLTDQYEIHIGKTAYIYELSRTSPAEALLAMNPSL